MFIIYSVLASAHSLSSRLRASPFSSHSLSSHLRASPFSSHSLSSHLRASPFSSNNGRRLGSKIPALVMRSVSPAWKRMRSRPVTAYRGPGHHTPRPSWGGRTRPVKRGHHLSVLRFHPILRPRAYTLMTQIGRIGPDTARGRYRERISLHALEGIGAASRGVQLTC